MATARRRGEVAAGQFGPAGECEPHWLLGERGWLFLLFAGLLGVALLPPPDEHVVGDRVPGVVNAD